MYGLSIDFELTKLYYALIDGCVHFFPSLTYHVCIICICVCLSLPLTYHVAKFMVQFSGDVCELQWHAF